MASQTQRANILQIALPAAFGHRHNVIRIPQALPRPRLQPPMFQQRLPARAPRITQTPGLGKRVYSTP